MLKEKGGLSSVDSHEFKMRRDISTLVRLIIVIMTSSHVIRPAAQWYAARVLLAYETINTKTKVKWSH